jgi:acyl-CoA hydrolase
MTISDSTRPQETRIVEMVFPNQTNHYGTVFGGDVLRLMDMAAFVTTSRHARRPVVTSSSERIDFHVPVRQGQLAEVLGHVTSTRRTSLTVEVELWAEDLLTSKTRVMHERQLCVGCR